MGGGWRHGIEKQNFGIEVKSIDGAFLPPAPPQSDMGDGGKYALDTVKIKAFHNFYPFLKTLKKGGGNKMIMK